MAMTYVGGKIIAIRILIPKDTDAHSPGHSSLRGLLRNPRL